MGKLLDELKRRKVIKVAVVYAVVAWLLIQVADTVFPALQMPPWTVSFVTILFLLGFPIALVLSWAYDAGPQGIRADSNVASAVSAPVQQNQGLLYGTFVLVLLVAGFQVADRFSGGEEPAEVSGSGVDDSNQDEPVTRISVKLPEDEYFSPDRGDFALSADGTLFVYRGVDEENRPNLWAKHWDQLHGRPLRNTFGATRPRISPDATEVVFQSGGAIKTVSIEGGVSRTLVVSDADTPDFSPDGNWVYFHSDEGIGRVSASGSSTEASVETAVKLNPDNGETNLLMVDALAGNRLLYAVGGGDDGDIIRATNLDTGQSSDLVRGNSPLYSAEGYLLFQSNEEATLLAAPFDGETLELTGPATVIAEDLLLVGAGNTANIAISETGRLIYRTGKTGGTLATPVWVDRAGKVTDIDANLVLDSSYGQGVPALSPTGDRLAFSIRSGRDVDIWVKYFDGPLSRITFGGGNNSLPNWTPDGQSLIYISDETGNARSLWRKRADGVGAPQLLLEKDYEMRGGFLSADGEWLIYREFPTGRQSSTISALRIGTEDEPIILIDNGFEAAAPALSPNGLWLAYTSNESGRNEVYVQPFPDVGSGRWQLSSEGGSEPQWAHSGQELFYRNGNNDFVAVSIEIAFPLGGRRQQVLFNAEGYRSDENFATYAVAPDDQRVVMMRMVPPSDTELIMVDNWASELR